MSRRSGVLLSAALVWLALPTNARAGTSARFAAARAKAQQAVAALKAQGETLAVRWAVDRPAPAMVRGMRVPVEGRTAEQRARRFLARYPDLVVGTEHLKTLEVRHAHDLTVVRFQQQHRGLPVLDAVLTVALDGKGRVRSLGAATGLVELDEVQPKLGSQQALAVAHKVVGSSGGGGSSHLAVAPLGGGRLVHVVTLPFPADRAGRRHLVDARSGEYLGWRTGAIVEEVRR
jgi:Zn-dependent metalloprotease